MKISHFMLTVSAVIFVWLTASYLRPVPAASYEHSIVQSAEESDSLLSDTNIPVSSDIEQVKTGL